MKNKFKLFLVTMLLATLMVGCGSNSMAGKYHCVDTFVTENVFEHENMTNTIDSIDTDLDALPKIKITGNNNNYKLTVYNDDDSHEENVVIYEEDEDSIFFGLSETTADQLAFLYDKDTGRLNMLMPITFDFDGYGVYEGYQGQTVMVMAYEK